MDNHFDIAIIGLGNAGSHVVLELLSRAENCRIVVIDKFTEDSMHKTWSFWEKGVGKWDHLLHHSWSKAIFKAPNIYDETNIVPYKYKSIQSKDFINHALALCESYKNVTIVHQNVHLVEQNNDLATISCEGISIKAKQVFDSRISKEFFLDKKALGVNQHFRGWFIKVKKAVFNPDEFIMMDYNLVDCDTTSFTYVLPYDANTALVEFTYFSNQTVEDSDYDFFLKKYINEELKIAEYEITSIEEGSIPMTNYDFSKHNDGKIHKIGTAGGWVKPSTGYSFKSSETKAKQLVSNYIDGVDLSHNLFSKKHQLLDSVLLDVIKNDNSKGPKVFTTLYTRHDIKKIFSFLDEKSTLLDDLKIMNSFISKAFIFGFFRQLLKKFLKK